jgi:hypothetical protein
LRNNKSIESLRESKNHAKFTQQHDSATPETRIARAATARQRMNGFPEHSFGHFPAQRRGASVDLHVHNPSWRPPQAVF